MVELRCLPPLLWSPGKGAEQFSPATHSCHDGYMFVYSFSLPGNMPPRPRPPKQESQLVMGRNSETVCEIPFFLYKLIVLGVYYSNRKRPSLGKQALKGVMSSSHAMGNSGK